MRTRTTWGSRRRQEELLTGYHRLESGGRSRTAPRNLPQSDPAPEDGGVEDDEEDEQDHSQEEHRPRHPRVRPEHEGKRSEEDDPASFR